VLSIIIEGLKVPVFKYKNFVGLARLYRLVVDGFPHG
jgi:hypothetical protein